MFLPNDNRVPSGGPLFVCQIWGGWSPFSLSKTSIEGGFSIIEKITTRESSTTGIDRGVKAEVGTEFGVPNVLSLLKLALGYSANWKKEKGEQFEKETERYYTYGALFYRLREYLDGNDLIKRPDDSQATWEAIKPSDFVEIRGVFHPNPFATSLGIMDRLLGMSQLFIGLPEPHAAKAIHEKALNSTEERKKAQEEKRAAVQAREQAEAQTKQMDDFRKIIQGVLKDIQSERTLCAYNSETTPPNNLVLRAEEKNHVSGTEW